jgi:hypothetical protein
VNLVDKEVKVAGDRTSSEKLLRAFSFGAFLGKSKGRSDAYFLKKRDMKHPKRASLRPSQKKKIYEFWGANSSSQTSSDRLPSEKVFLPLRRSDGSGSEMLSIDVDHDVRLSERPWIFRTF